MTFAWFVLGENERGQMQVAVIGGTRHVGHAIVGQLVKVGHQVTVYNRGRTVASLPAGVQRVVIDRRVPGQLGQALGEHRPDAVIDMIGYGIRDVQEVYSALPQLHHYVFCSSTAVYGRIGSSTPSPYAPTASIDHTTGAPPGAGPSRPNTGAGAAGPAEPCQLPGAKGEYSYKGYRRLRNKGCVLNEKRPNRHVN